MSTHLAFILYIFGSQLLCFLVSGVLLLLVYNSGLALYGVIGGVGTGLLVYGVFFLGILPHSHFLTCHSLRSRI
jgi:hypothetical protein